MIDLKPSVFKDIGLFMWLPRHYRWIHLPFWSTLILWKLLPSSFLSSSLSWLLHLICWRLCNRAYSVAQPSYHPFCTECFWTAKHCNVSLLLGVHLIIFITIQFHIHNNSLDLLYHWNLIFTHSFIWPSLLFSYPHSFLFNHLP